MANYRELMDTIPEVEWEVGDDEENPGRFSAVIRWDDEERKIHNTLSVVNEPSLLSAVEGVLEEWQHMRDLLEAHF